MGQIKNIKLHIVTDIKVKTKMAGYGKKVTDLTGMVVASTPRQTLVSLYTKTLAAVAGIPTTSPYREQVQAITEERLDLVNQAQDELSLVEKMVEWKSWEPLIDPAPPGQWGH